MAKTSTEVKNRWNAANYDRIVISIPKEDAAKYKALCTAQGITLSEIPKQAILDYIGECHD